MPKNYNSKASLRYGTAKPQFFFFFFVMTLSIIRFIFLCLINNTEFREYAVIIFFFFFFFFCCWGGGGRFTAPYLKEPQVLTELGIDHGCMRHTYWAHGAIPDHLVQCRLRVWQVTAVFDDGMTTTSDLDFNLALDLGLDVGVLGH